MPKKIYLYPVWVRLWHWLNAIACLLLIITGISLQYSDPEYPFMRFDLAIAVHNFSGIVLTAGFFVFLFGNIISGNGKHYKLKNNDLTTRLKRQIKYYSGGLFKSENPPYPINADRKFNPLQKISYVGIMYVALPVLIVTGWAMLIPEITVHDFFGISGLHLTHLLHLVVGFITSLFLVVHVYFCTIGSTPYSHFKAMFNGFHEVHE